MLAQPCLFLISSQHHSSVMAWKGKGARRGIRNYPFTLPLPKRRLSPSSFFPRELPQSCHCYSIPPKAAASWEFSGSCLLAILDKNYTPASFCFPHLGCEQSRVFHAAGVARCHHQMMGTAAAFPHSSSLQPPGLSCSMPWFCRHLTFFSASLI